MLIFFDNMIVFLVPLYVCQKLAELERKLITLNSGDENAVKSVIEKFRLMKCFEQVINLNY